MQVYITEKPSVAKALVEYFNKNGANFKLTKDRGSYADTDQKAAITWAVGHIMGLYQPKQYKEEWAHWNIHDLPILPDDYKFKKYVKANLKKRYAAIKALVESATTVIHAGDPDREGQVLIDEILESIKKAPKTVKRLKLNALDDKSIKEAMQSIDDNAAYKGLNRAGNMRSIIDWLIGINLSRYFTMVAKKGGYGSTVNVGRVKTPTLAMIVKREKEIQNFKESLYYKLTPILEIDGQQVPVTMNNLTKFDRKEDAEVIAQSIHSAIASVESVDRKEVVQTVNELYNMDTLQIEAAKAFNYTPKQTAEILQTLYEKKLTTYPRSDCKFLPEGQLADAPKILKQIQEAQILPVRLNSIPDRIYEAPKPFNDKKITAHHAIIPTTLAVKDCFAALSSDEQNIYRLIATKYASMFFEPHKYNQETILFTVNTDDEYTLKLTLKNITHEGWKALYRKDVAEKEPNDDAIEGSFQIEESSVYTIIDSRISEHTTKPPKRYTPGSIIQAMTNITSDDPDLAKVLKNVKGIGTPATRATIVDELTSSGLITVEKKYLVPTRESMKLLDFIPDEVKSAEYTALMELDLDALQNNEISEFDLIQKIEGFIRTVLEQKQTVIVFDQSFPCPICNKGHLIFKQYRKDDDLIRYFRCSNEECNHTFPAHPDKELPEYVKCPACEQGFIKEKRSKSGNVFYGCSNYPACKQSYSNRKEFEPVAKERNIFLHIKSSMEETFKE